MKIAFVGKGGSGKTTISSLFTRYLAQQSLPVLAIDADINQHMARGLGISEQEARNIPPLGLGMDTIKEYLRGTNPLIQDNRSMLKTTPPGSGSRLLSMKEDNELFKYFEYKKNGIRFLATGPFNESDLGVKCYHSKIGAVELILNHLIDREKEYVVVDMTAGADSFASGLFTRFDITFVIVEPTIKSVEVYKQYKYYAKDHGVHIQAVGNKIESEEDTAFLNAHIGNNLLNCISNSRYIRQMEKGNFLSLENLEVENKKILELLQNATDNCVKNWSKYLSDMKNFHIKNALSWANVQLGIQAETQIDNSFSFRL